MIECPECKGKGKIFVSSFPLDLKVCPKCLGQKQIEPKNNFSDMFSSVFGTLKKGVKK